MMEKSLQKKIVSYLDGSLSSSERVEFEAHVAANPDLKEQIRQKEEEIEKLRRLIPTVRLAARTAESLNYEIKQSVFTLLKREPRNFWEGLKDRFEEWINR